MEKLADTRHLHTPSLPRLSGDAYVVGSRADSNPCALPDDRTHASGQVHRSAYPNRASGYADTHRLSNRDAARTYCYVAHVYQSCHPDQLTDAVAKLYAYQSCHLHQFADAVAKLYACQSCHLHQFTDAVTKLYADLHSNRSAHCHTPTHGHSYGRGRYAHRRERREPVRHRAEV